jgi:PAS domain S-box-containing protein
MNNKSDNLLVAAETSLLNTPIAKPDTHTAEELLHKLQVQQIELEMQNEELRRTHALLEEARDRYFHLYNHAPVGYILLSSDGLISEINLTATELIGMSHNKLLSRRFVSLIAPINSDQWYLFFSKVMKLNKRLSIELMLKGFNDTEIPVQLDCQHVNSMLRITLTDITKIKHAEKTLREAEALALINSENIQKEKVREGFSNKLQKIASQLPGLVFQFRLHADGRSCFPYASAAIREIYRLSPEDVLEDASKVFALLHPDDYDGIITSIQNSERDLSPWSYEYRVKFDDGTVRWLLGNALLQRDTDGSTLWHGFITDITSRKQSENNQRLSKIALQSISQGVLITDADQNILWTYNAFESITGYNLTEILTRNCLFFQGPLTDPQTIRDISLALKNQTEFSGDILNYRKDNTVFWNELTITPVFGELGQLSNFICTSRDVTERKQLARTLQQSHQQLHSLIKQAPLSIAMFDTNMNYLEVSDIWMTEFGQGIKNLIGCNHYDMYPDLPDEWRIIHQQCLAGAFLKNDDDCFLQKDGSQYWLRWAVSPWINSEGAIGGIIITSENITDRKQLTEDLSVVKKRLELAVECGEIGVWDLDLIHHTCWRSPWHDQIFGYEVPPSEWNHIIALRHIFPDDQDKFIHAFSEAINTGKLLLQCRIIQPDQSVRWISIRGRVLYDEVAQPIRMLGTVIDNTEHQNRKQKAKEHLDQLAHVTRLGLMGEMASGIAHEVNQPLTAIATYAQVSLNLIKKENPDLIKLAEVIVKTQEQALRAGQIIHRMKAFCKSKSPQRSASDINELINECVNLCADALKQNRIKLTLELAGNLPLIDVEHIQIEQVLINLIRNGIDATLSGTEIKQGEIIIRSNLILNNSVQVCVKDNGMGISEVQRVKMLMPFYTTKSDGMGMGLSISRSLIEAHGGILNFNSQLGKGSTFYFTLPI